jgi:osmotically-inducible protein OsmY
MTTPEASDRGVTADEDAEFDTEVVLPPSQPSDEELTLALIEALPDGVRVSVQDGWAVIHGTVEWMYQKLADGRTARAMPGVLGVTNLIAVQTELTTAELAKYIRDAIGLNLGDAAKRVVVRVVGSQAILSGMVHSWPERDECGRTAAFAPGITAVDNRTTVAYDLPD